MKKGNREATSKGDSNDQGKEATRWKGKENNNRDRQRREIVRARNMYVTHHDNSKRVCSSYDNEDTCNQGQ